MAVDCIPQIESDPEELMKTNAILSIGTQPTPYNN